MKTIKRIFDNIKQLNPFWSDYICFAESIKNRNYTARIVSKWFNKLVGKADYHKKDKKQVLNFLQTLTLRKSA